MNKKGKGYLLLVGVFVFLILIAFGLLMVFSDDPVQIEVSQTTCLTSYCLVAQKVSLNLKVIPNGNRNISNIRIDSPAVDQDSINISKRDISVSEPVSIPISFSIKNGIDANKYKFSIKADTTKSGFMDFFWSIKNLMSEEITFYEKDFEVRYPVIDFNFYQKSEDKEKITSTYDLDIRNKDNNVINCKVKIQSSIDIFIEHRLLKQISETSKERVYESPYTNINVNENGNCCNTIMLKANTQAATAQIKVFPICNIDGTDVILKDYVRNANWKHNSKEIEPSLFS